MNFSMGGGYALKRVAVVALSAAVLSLFGCRSLRSMVEAVRRPEVRVLSAELEELTFTGATVRFDVEVRNPNPIGIELAGLDYELRIEGRPFLSGSVRQAVMVAARGRSVVPIPVALDFERVISTFQELAESGEAAYRLAVSLFFNLPVLGSVRVVRQGSGTVPIPRLPTLRLGALRVESLSVDRARLDLVLEVGNPNDFRVFIESLDYRFQVAGEDWAKGMLQKRVRLPEHGSVQVKVPIEVDLQAIGMSAYRALLGRDLLPYRLEASAVAGSSLKGLKKAVLPVSLSGEIRVER